MIAVVMEKSCRNPRDWAGAVGGKLGGLLYIDLSEEAQWDVNMKRLIDEINRVTIDERIFGRKSKFQGGDCMLPLRKRAWAKP